MILMQDSLFMLLGSETRAKLLDAFFSDERRRWTLSALAEKTGCDAGGVHRELSNLRSVGIMAVDTSGNSKLYCLNANHPLFGGLKELVNQAKADAGGYFLFEELPVMYPLFVSAALDVRNINALLPERGLKTRFSRSLLVYENGGGRIYFLEKEFEQLSQEIVGKLLEDPGFGEKDS
ncbi:MAG: winged helix-turn-helix domain-containing protein, partial [Candidatus Micrarchaeota archaeon]